MNYNNPLLNFSFGTNKELNNNEESPILTINALIKFLTEKYEKSNDIIKIDSPKNTEKEIINKGIFEKRLNNIFKDCKVTMHCAFEYEKASEKESFIASVLSCLINDFIIKQFDEQRRYIKTVSDYFPKTINLEDLKKNIADVFHVNIFVLDVKNDILTNFPDKIVLYRKNIILNTNANNLFESVFMYVPNSKHILHTDKIIQNIISSFNIKIEQECLQKYKVKAISNTLADKQVLNRGIKYGKKEDLKENKDMIKDIKKEEKKEIELHAVNAFTEGSDCEELPDLETEILKHTLCSLTKLKMQDLRKIAKPLNITASTKKELIDKILDLE